jgi:metal-responsive CopG/Arc/MetJ family transcriptional regulator
MSRRRTKVIGFSVQPEMYEEILRYAQKENKSKSELFREMVSLYRSKKEEESRPKGVGGRELLRFSAMFTEDELREISTAVTEECDRVDKNEW